MPMECNVDVDPTVLYMMVQGREWAHVMRRADEFPEETQTQVWRLEHDSGVLRWRMLPLHVAIILSAPTPVIEVLLDNFSDAAKYFDDIGMLPIHLAVKKHATEEVINMLVAAYPDSIDAPNYFGLTPFEMAVEGTSPHKFHYLQVLKRGPTFTAITASSNQTSSRNHGPEKEVSLFLKVDGGMNSPNGEKPVEVRLPLSGGDRDASDLLERLIQYGQKEGRTNLSHFLPHSRPNSDPLRYNTRDRRRDSQQYLPPTRESDPIRYDNFGGRRDFLQQYVPPSRPSTTDRDRERYEYPRDRYDNSANLQENMSRFLSGEEKLDLDHQIRHDHLDIEHQKKRLMIDLQQQRRIEREKMKLAKWDYKKQQDLLQLEKQRIRQELQLEKAERRRIKNENRRLRRPLFEWVIRRRRSTQSEF